MKFKKEKIDNAVKAVEDMCSHCEKHTDDRPVVKISSELKSLL